jgi:hypothetical protein
MQTMEQRSMPIPVIVIANQQGTTPKTTNQRAKFQHEKQKLNKYPMLTQ